MAEFALYGNITSPRLVLETVLPALSWLPAELTTYAARSAANFHIFETVLNILLVFAGARTSALLDNLKSDYSPFITRLNDALFETGESAFRLDIDSFYMGESVFRENNPRFIHSHTKRLGHQEIGHNLDFFTPANIDSLADEEKIYISIYEMQTWTHVTGEVVAKRCIQSDEDMQLLKRFTDKKVELFNHAFEELRLPYNFKWFFVDPKLDHVMTNSTPPSSEWWAENWFEVAISTVGNRPHLGNIFNHYEKHWDVITTIWNYHWWAGMWMREDEHFHNRVETVYNQVNDYISQGIPVDLDNLSLKLGKLEAEGREEIVRRMKPRWKLEALGHLKRVVVGEVGHWFRWSKRSGNEIELSRGIECSGLEDRFWTSMVSRLIRFIKYIIFY